MAAYTRGMSTTTPAKNYSGIPTRTEGGHTPTPLAPNSDAGCSTEPPTSASPYNPTELAKALLALLGILLGLTLALGGWQPHTSAARLGWSHGDIVVTNGTDGDTGSRPLPPHDAGVRPAGDTLPVSSSLSTGTPDSPGTSPTPIDLGKALFEGGGPGGASSSPWSGGSQA